MSKHIAEIYISSWAGISVGATHYYGEIRYDSGRKYHVIEIRRRLTKKEADKLTLKGDNFTYRAGQSTERFDSREEIIELGMKSILKKWKGNIRIIVGSGGESNPSEVLWCTSNKKKKKLNSLWEQAEAMYKITNDPWGLDENKAEQIWGEWEDELNDLFDQPEKKKIWKDS